MSDDYAFPIVDGKLVPAGSHADIAARAKLDPAALQRYSQRVIKAIIKSAPTLLKHLKIEGEQERVAHQADIPGLDKLDRFIVGSYIIIKGEKQRTLYFAVLEAKLYQQLLEDLESNPKTQQLLTDVTHKIQFCCPDAQEGFGFKVAGRSLTMNKQYELYRFPVTKAANNAVKKA